MIMQVTIPTKVAKIVKIPVNPSVELTAQVQNNLTLGQIKNVNINEAEQGDVLMLVGTSWEAQPLDGGTFN